MNGCSATVSMAVRFEEETDDIEHHDASYSIRDWEPEVGQEDQRH
jgi:hypothetical protein